jgi:anti-anti-sigma factor
MGEGRVLHASHEGVHVLRFVGDVRYPLSPALDRFVEATFQGTTPAAFVLDLTETESVDSTNLGIMARIAKHMRERGAPRVTILSDREDVNELLASIGFDEVFDIVDASGRRSFPAEELPAGEPAPDELARTVLEAHRTLMALNERNHALFRDVVAALEREVGEGNRD